MGILNNLSGGAVDRIADTLGQDPESAKGRAFKRDFSAATFDSFGGSVDTDQFYEIAAYEVPASTEVAWGYGRASNPENQGYLYVDLQSSTPSAIEGTLQLVQESPTGREKVVVQEFETTTLDGSKTDRTQRVPLPEQVDKDLVTQDSRLVVYLKADSSTTVDETESDVIFPVTEYDLSQRR